MTTVRRALLLAPMSSELRPVIKYTKARRSKVGDLTVYTGRAGEVDIVVAQLGVGPASSHRVTGRTLSHFPVDHVLVSGIAGGLDPDLTIGTVVVPEVVMDVGSGRRYHSAPMEGG
jgi:adenosylhomocysteine nucleosidase